MTMPHPFTTRAVRLAGAVALLASLLGLASCSHKYSADGVTSDGTGAATELLAPGPVGAGLGLTSARTLYPLAVGNHWDYHIRTVNQITTAAGPQPPVVEEQPLADEITGTQTIDGRDYFLQSEFDPRLPLPNGSVFNLRGNRFGLFELDSPQAQQGLATDAQSDHDAAALSAYVDRAVADPAQRAAFRRAAAEVAAKLAAARLRLAGQRPGAVPGEITLLSYPIYTGARWIVREDPRFARIVVGPERVNLPLGTFAAWKIRGTSELFGPEDRLLTWYSRLGLLRVRFHGIVNAADDTGAIIGQVVVDSDQSLTGIHLVRPGAALVAGDGARE
jgi:hypothetical protein